MENSKRPEWIEDVLESLSRPLEEIYSEHKAKVDSLIEEVKKDKVVMGGVEGPTSFYFKHQDKLFIALECSSIEDAEEVDEETLKILMCDDIDGGSNTSHHEVREFTNEEDKNKLIFELNFD